MPQASDIAHIIQLSVAPVFLLAGIGALLNVLTARLARVIDRARHLEEALTATPAHMTVPRIRNELASLDRRMVIAQRAIYMCTLAALLVCFEVAALFVGALVSLNFSALVGVLFVAAMVSLIGGLTLFLFEISIATRTLRVRAELFSKPEEK